MTRSFKIGPLFAARRHDMDDIFKRWLFCMAYFAILLVPALLICTTPIPGDILAIAWIAICLISALIAILGHCVD